MLSFWVWLVSPRTQDAFFFLFTSNFHDVVTWEIVHCVNVTYFLYPFLDWGTSKLLPGSSYDKQSLYYAVGHQSWWYDWAIFFPKSSLDGSWGGSIPNSLRKCHIDFQHGCTGLCFHWQLGSVPLTAVLLVRLASFLS